MSGLIVLSVLLRIYRLGYESLTLDEMASINVAKKSIGEIVSIRSNNPPLYYLILHFMINLFGDSEFSIRFPSVIFGSISIYLIYSIGKNIFDKNVGILSAFILSISIFHILFSQTARFYSLLVLLVLLSNYYFIKILEDSDPKKDKKNTLRYMISTLLMIYTHGYGLLYLIFQNIYYLLFKKNISIRYWLKVQGIIILFFIPWINNMIDSFSTGGIGGEGTNWIQQPSIFSLYDLFRFYAGTNDIGVFIFIIVCMMDIFIIKNIDHPYLKDSNRSNIQNNSIIPNKNPFDRRNFLFLWLFFPIVVSFIISLISKPIYINRYVIGSLPAFLIILSKGIIDLRKYSMILTPITIMVLVLPTISSMEAYYNNLDQEQWRDAANYIESNIRNDEIILLYVANIDRPFGYYYKNGTNTPFLDTIHHSGQYSVKIDISGNTNRISGNIRSDVIEVDKLQNYTFSAWGMIKDIGGKNFPAARATELDKDGKTLKTNNLIFDNTTEGWTEKKKTFQTSANTSHIYLLANIYEGYGTFWIDDLSLVSEKNSENLISNPGFEVVNFSQPIGWNFIKKDNYYGISDSKNIEKITKDYKGIWLIISHAWSNEMKNESKLIMEKLSNKYKNQSNINFVGMEIYHYHD